MLKANNCEYIQDLNKARKLYAKFIDAFPLKYENLTISLEGNKPICTNGSKQMPVVCNYNPYTNEIEVTHTKKYLFKNIAQLKYSA